RMRRRYALDLELETLARDDDLDALCDLICLLLRFLGDPIERFVASVRVVVIEDEPLDPRLRGDLDGARDRRMAPRRLEVAFEELRVVDERVGVACENDHRVDPSREGILGVRRIDERAPI